MAFDYMGSIEETVVAEGLEGKIIMVYGGNNLGKSKNSVQFPMSMTLPLEPNALNAIGGAKKLPIHNYGAFKDFVFSMHKDKSDYERALRMLEKEASKKPPKDPAEKKEYTERIEKLQAKVDDSPYAKFRKICKTLIIDTLTALGKSVEQYVLDEADVQELGDVGHGKLYKRMENEFYRTITKFFELGDFTYLILAHEDFVDISDDKNNPVMKAVPKGDWKRVVKPVIDRCDIVAYLKGNGTDEDHKVIPSSAILAECDLCFARTKWDNMTLYLEEYSAKNLEKAIQEAINDQRENGVPVATFQEQQRSYLDTLKVNWEEIRDKIREYARQIYEHDGQDEDGVNFTKYTKIVEEFLGDKTILETNEKHISHLTNILSRVEDLMEELI